MPTATQVGTWGWFSRAVFPTAAQVQKDVVFGPTSDDYTGTFGHAADAELTTVELDHIRIIYEMGGKAGISALIDGF